MVSWSLLGGSAEAMMQVWRDWREGASEVEDPHIGRRETVAKHVIMLRCLELRHISSGQPFSTSEGFNVKYSRNRWC